jgi:hypothetical protein
MKKLIILIFTSFSYATVINIPDDYSAIQEGIDASVDGDTVLVQPNTYYENINFNGHNIILGSLFLTTADTSYISQTIIDGNQNGSVITFDSGEDSTAIITGFSITNGYSPHGGGIACTYSSPQLKYLSIYSNATYEYSGHGGGIQLSNSDAMLYSLSIKNNFAFSGAGISFGQNSYASISKVQLISNTSYYVGGGISIDSNSSPIFTDVLIAKNVQTGYAGLDDGGGAAYIYGANPVFINTTFANNSAEDIERGGLLCKNGANLEIMNSILWNETSEEIYFYSTNNINSISINYSDIQGSEDAIITNDNCSVDWGEGNIDINPQFADPANENYSIQYESPCIDAGDPEGEFDPDGTIADIGAFYYHQELGCTESLALNYNPDATIDDGSCLFDFTNNDGPLEVLWVKKYNGVQFEHIFKTTDNYYLMSGNSWRNGNSDVYVVKTGEDGIPIWDNVYSESNGNIYNEYSHAIAESVNGGYLSAGRKNQGNYETIYIVKIDENGNQVYEGDYVANARAEYVTGTQDGGYVIAGSNTNGFYLNKLSSNEINTEWEYSNAGSQNWCESYPGTAWQVIELFDSSLVAVGSGCSLNGQNGNINISKVSADGNLIWSNNFGDEYVSDTGKGIAITSDGGFIVVGGRNNDITDTDNDIVLLKIDSNGQLEWEREYALDGYQVGYSIQQTQDGGYIVSGATNVDLENWEVDSYVMRFSIDGDLLWTQLFGFEDSDYINHMVITAENQFIFVGGGDNVAYAVKFDSEISGCNDPIALNYNPDAIVDDGSCLYEEAGCNDETAYNYNENAQWNDGSCIYYGDINSDGNIDVVDVIAMVGFVLENNDLTPEQILIGDLYPDGLINIYDIVSVISIIMSDSLLNTLSLTEVSIIKEHHSLRFTKTGSIAGIQIEYEGDFESSLEGWMIEKNENTILMVSMDGSDLNKLNYSGDLKIKSCSVVDWELNKIQAEITVIPDQFSLKPAYPNPFNPVTTINYAIPHDAYVVIKAFDVRGKEVAELVNGMIKEGNHEVVWDASKLSSGMYFVRMTSGDYKGVQKIIYLK